MVHISPLLRSNSTTGPQASAIISSCPATMSQNNPGSGPLLWPESLRAPRLGSLRQSLLLRAGSIPRRAAVQSHTERVLAAGTVVQLRSWIPNQVWKATLASFFPLACVDHLLRLCVVRLSCSAESSDGTTGSNQLSRKKRGKTKRSSDRDHGSPE